MMRRVSLSLAWCVRSDRYPAWLKILVLKFALFALAMLLGLLLNLFVN
jgi:hypothetical protein